MEKQISFESDMLTNLPDNIIEDILSYVPIKDAVRTSLLSKKWKYRWASIPGLVFDETYILHSSFKFNERDFTYSYYFKDRAHKLVNFIDKTLSLHRGSIQKFKLFTKCIQNSRAVDSWIPFLSSGNIKELVLTFDTMTRYKVPNSVFSLKTLEILRLVHCFIRPPPSFEGLKNLTVIDLTDVTLVNEENLENMILNCPVLQDLRLFNIRRPTSLKIDAPNLRKFFLDSHFKDICFINVTSLTDVCIRLDYISKSDKKFRDRGSSRMINILGSLTIVGRLSLYGYFLEFLAFDLPRCFELPFKYQHLSKVALEVNFTKLNEILLTICLLKSTPILEQLDIEVYSNEGIGKALGKEFWEEQNCWDNSLTHLNVVKFNELWGTRNELDFIKYLLANAPELKVLSIEPNLEADFIEPMLFEELETFHRASASSKFIYSGEEFDAWLSRHSRRRTSWMRKVDTQGDAS